MEEKKKRHQLRAGQLGDGAWHTIDAFRRDDGMWEAIFIYIPKGTYSSMGHPSPPLRVAENVDNLRQWAESLASEVIKQMAERYRRS